MTIYVIEATQTGDTIPGLTFAQPVQVTPTPFSVGMEMYYRGKSIDDYLSDVDMMRGWLAAQKLEGLR